MAGPWHQGTWALHGKALAIGDRPQAQWHGWHGAFGCNEDPHPQEIHRNTRISGNIKCAFQWEIKKSKSGNK